MRPVDRSALEQEIRARHEQADLVGAAERAMRGYGPEIYGFLRAFHRSEQDAAEVFSVFAERLWRGLPGFGWDCSFRTWAYVVARNAAQSYREQTRRHERRHVPLPETSALSRIADEVRSETAPHLKSHAKERIAHLRQSLSEEDRALLSLRLDRKLGWSELARVLHDRDEPLTEEALKRASARLRKRFQTIKASLVELAKREGLLERAD